jgi:predicted RecA/RadA family phage recombinase
MRNQVYTGTNVSRRFALCPTTVVSGDAVLIGTIPGVALDSYQANTGGTTFLCNGSFTLTVIAATVVSPITGSQVNPGDKLYVTGTLDSATNVTTGLVISKASGGTLFGPLDPSDPAIPSATTSTSATVVLEAEI